MGIFDKFFGKQASSQAAKAALEPIQPSANYMAPDRFWEIIETSKAKGTGVYERQQEELKKELSRLSALEVMEFDNQFRHLRGKAYTWELWAAAYIMNGGCSDDCFSDFRGWVIGQGKVVFERALSDPETLVALEHDADEDDWEGIGYVPMTVYESKTGDAFPAGGASENFDISGTPWSEDGDELENKYPTLWAKWG